MKYTSFLIGLLIVVASFAFCEGTVSQGNELLGTPNKVTLSWTASTNGIATGSTSPIRGEIVRVVFMDGATIPTTAYDVTLSDASGVDVLAGLGANIATNVITSVVPGIAVVSATATNAIPYQVNDILDLSVTNGGSEKTGIVILYVK